MGQTAAQLLNQGGPPKPPQDDQASKLLKRIDHARLDRSRHQSRIAACYKYGMPWRHKFDATEPVDVLDEVFDDTAMTVLEDFAADMLNTFTPMKSQWVEFNPSQTLDAGQRSQIKDALKAYGDTLFAEIRRSNCYQALQESYLDLAVGTMALSITDIGATEPIHCEAIPATELLLSRGLYGRIDGNWREWLLSGEEIGVTWPAAIAKAPNGTAWRPGDCTRYKVIHGVYRDWSTPATEVWKYAVLVEGKIVYEETYRGRGSSPMITGRWSRDSTTAWGIGPLYRTSPSVKALNFIDERFLKLFDKIVDPPASYEDDGVVNLDNGIEAGMWIPRATGSKAPEVIESKGKLDFGLLKRDDLISQIRRAHYQDRPEQLGKTPPSATQWADEAAERARRMGTPATNLVNEVGYGIVNRFAYLLARRGLLPKVELNGKEITLEPVSPLLRAQQQEVVMRRHRLVELLAPLGPQITSVVINAAKYASDQAKDLGVEDIVNTEEQIKAAIEQFGELVKNARAGATPEAPGAIP